MDFLKKRADQARQRRGALVDQTVQQQHLRDQVTAQVAMLKEILANPNYAGYKQLLLDTRKSLLDERDAILQTETDREVRDHQTVLLTGRIMQLTMILDTPDMFFTLAEQSEANGSAPRPLARQPVR